MFSVENFNSDNFSSNLVSAVGDRIANAAYSDAILAGTQVLTNTLREKGGCEGDGVQLVGQVLGGTAPKLSINPLKTVSEKDEQKGIEQLLRGYYTAIRNPRTHENIEDTEKFCIQIMVLIDTVLEFLNREVEEFDVPDFANRIYDPHFVASKEYAETLISQIPPGKLMAVFLKAFERRAEGRAKDIKYVFNAMYQLMSEDDLKTAMERLGEDLRAATETTEVANLFRLMKPKSWQLLQNDVKMRIENMVIESCKAGRYDLYAGTEKGKLGSWGNTFGRYFTRREDLGNTLISKLESSWYTQNYVANYFIYSLPAIITTENQLKELAENLAYAAISNNAKLLRSELLNSCKNYPATLKELLKVSVQERRDNDPEYADKLLKFLD